VSLQIVGDGPATASITGSPTHSVESCTGNVTWTSNPITIASVSGTTITAVAPGTAEITATCNGTDCTISDKYTVTVTAKATTTTVDTKTFIPGSTTDITVTIAEIFTWGSGLTPTGTYSVSSSNSSVATAKVENNSVVITPAANAAAGASANITVSFSDTSGLYFADAATITVNAATVTGITLTTPTNITYDWGASTWDVTGGKVAVNWSNGESSSPIDLTADMITTPVSVLSQIGEHDVKVKHLEQEATFKVTVNAPAEVEVGATPAAGATGVTEGKDNVTDPTATLSVEAAAVSADKLGATDGSMGVTFSLNNGTVNAGKSIKVQIPMPAGAKSGDTFKAVDSDGASVPVSASADGKGLILTLNANQINNKKAISIGWTAATSATPADPPCRPWVSPQERFWRDVANAIWRSCPGSVIRVSAPGNWQVPTSVMRALYSSRDVTLVIRTPAGDRISINSDDAIGPHYSHRGYPIAWLRQMYDNDSDRKSGSSGGGKVTTLAKTPEKEAAKPEPAPQEPVQQPVEAAPEPIKAGEPAPAKPEPAPEPAQPAPEAEQPEAVAAAASAGGNTGMTVLIAAIAFVGGAIAALAVKMKKKSE